VPDYPVDPQIRKAKEIVSRLSARDLEVLLLWLADTYPQAILSAAQSPLLSAAPQSPRS